MKFTNIKQYFNLNHHDLVTRYYEQTEALKAGLMGSLYALRDDEFRRREMIHKAQEGLKQEEKATNLKIAELTGYIGLINKEEV